MAIRFKRVQILMTTQTVDVLREISTDWRKKSNFERVGIGTVVSQLIDAVVAAKPEIMSELLDSAERSFPGQPEASWQRSQRWHVTWR